VKVAQIYALFTTMVLAFVSIFPALRLALMGLGFISSLGFRDGKMDWALPLFLGFGVGNNSFWLCFVSLMGGGPFFQLSDWQTFSLLHKYRPMLSCATKKIIYPFQYNSPKPLEL
jgi:hypothetical protein